MTDLCYHSCVVPDDVRHLRLKLGMDVPEFARLMGVDARTVVRWESGKASPKGAAEAVMTGLREALDRDTADQVVKFVLGAAAVGGVAYLLVKLFDHLGSKRSSS